MIRKNLKHGVALTVLAVTLSTPLSVAGQQLPDAPSYPTNTTRPTPRAPAPPPPRAGGLIITPRPPEPPTPPPAPVEVAPPDVQLANGWITQGQYDQLMTQVQESTAVFEREVRRNASDTVRAQRETNDRMLEAIANFGTMSADSTQLLQQMGYSVAQGTPIDNPRQSAEAFMTLIENVIRTEQNVGNTMRPGVQGYVALIDRAAASNIQMLRETGHMPAEMLRAYERSADDLHNRAIARIDRTFYEHDREVENAQRILTERRTQIVEGVTRAIEVTRARYGSDPRNWPQTPLPRQQPTRFSYIGMLTPTPATPPPPPPPNPRNLPALGGPDRPQPVPDPVPSVEPTPGPAPVPTQRRPVRVGEIPPADPYEGLRVPTPSPSPAPRPRTPTPSPQPRPQQRVPDPVVLQQQTPDVELGLPQDGGDSSPSVIEQIMARIPRNRDGSIDWARVPLAIRAQVILYEQRHRSLGGGSGSGGAGGGGADSDDPLVRELVRRQDEQYRLTAAAQRQAAQNANWNAMVADRFGTSAWDAFNASRMTTLELEPIYRDYNPLNTIPPAMSLSSAGTSLSAAGQSLSSAGADYRDPAVESLYQTMGMFDYRSRSNPYASGIDGDPARAAQFAYNAGDFDVQFNRDGRLHQESGGRLAGSLFTFDEWYLRQVTANGLGGLNALLAQPFNVILTWGANAYDLDLHMTGPLGAQANERFHIYYAATGNLAAQPFAALIKDCICRTGSEVILTSALNRGGVYRVSVFNFGDQSASSTNLATASQATIQIVRGGTTQSVGNGTTLIGGRVLLTTTVSGGGAGNTWVAAEINAANGRITVPNQIRQSAGSGGVQ